MNRLDRSAAKRIFSDWKIYCGTLMYFGIVNTGYATSFFTPTILTELGWKSLKAQYMSVPIYITASIICLATAWCTDRARHRYSFCILGILVATTGYGILLAPQPSVPTGARYAAVYLVVSGCYMCQPITIAWINNCMGGHYKRSVSSALMIGFGNLGGIVASNIFIASEAPGFKTGYGTSLGLMWGCGLACTALLLGLRRENRARERGDRDWRLEGPDADNLGDDHPHFRFTY